MYELIYKEGQEAVEMTLPEARAAALRLVGEDIEHKGTTYKVQEAHFDPTRGIVVTTIAGKTFVLVRLKNASKKPPPSHAGARKEKPESRGPGKRLKCTCGKCHACGSREYWRKKHASKKKKAKAETPRPRGRPPKKAKAAPERATQTSGIPEENVRKGVVAMFKAGMSLPSIAEAFDVSVEVIEGLVREAI